LLYFYFAFILLLLPILDILCSGVPFLFRTLCICGTRHTMPSPTFESRDDRYIVEMQGVPFTAGLA
jgi:hypothetical protein